MQVISKSGIINVEVYQDNSYLDKEFFEAIAYDRQGNQMGFVNFHLGKKNEAWIWLIETEGNFQHHGVGQTLLSVMEYIVAINKYDYIEGRYYPKNEFAHPLYLKNNYKIEHDDYDQYVYKRFSKTDIERAIQKGKEIMLSPLEIKDISKKPSRSSTLER